MDRGSTPLASTFSIPNLRMSQTSGSISVFLMRILSSRPAQLPPRRESPGSGTTARKKAVANLTYPNLATDTTTTELRTPGQPFLAGPGNFHRNGTAPEGAIIKIFARVPGSNITDHRNETEAAGSTAPAVDHHQSIAHRTGGGEKIIKIGLRGLVGQISNMEFGGIHMFGVFQRARELGRLRSSD